MFSYILYYLRNIYYNKKIFSELTQPVVNHYKLMTLQMDSTEDLKLKEKHMRSVFNEN